MDRAYTVKEIDALRIVTTDRLAYGSSAREKWEKHDNGHGFVVLGIRAIGKGEVEDQVRTYMLAGITADDILNEDRKP